MDDHSKAIARVLSKAWTDPSFHARLKAEPHTVLHEYGLHTSPSVMVHEDTAAVSHFVVPLRPSHLTDDDLTKSEPHPDLCCTACI